MYASVPDLRRTFGERWAVRAMPHVLKELMRRESIDTTLPFYVGRNAQQTATVLREAHQSAATGDISGNTDSSETPTATCRSAARALA